MTYNPTVHEAGDEADELRAERRLALAALLVAAVLAWSGFQGYEHRVVALTRALLAGRLWIDPDAEATIDKAVDPATGHAYSGGPPGLAVALVAPYAVLERLPISEEARRVWLVLLGAGVPFALGAVAVRRAIRRAEPGAGPEAAQLAAAVYAFGTIALTFGARLYGHAASTALLAGALALALRPLPEPAEPAPAEPEPDEPAPAPEADAFYAPAATPASWAVAGACAATAVTIDYGVVVPAAAIVALALWRGGRRAAGLAVAGTLPLVLLLGLYHWACFGAPWRTAYDLHADPEIAELMASGFGFRLPRPRLVLELLVGLHRGVLVTQPLVLVGAVGLFYARSRAGRVALFTAVAVLLLNAARVHDWDAGTSFGSRYLCGALPFVALGLPRGLGALGPARPWVVGAGLVLAGLGPTTMWGSAQTSFASLLLLGPRACGLCVLTLGVDPGTSPALTTTLLSAFGLAAAATTALFLVAPRAPRGAVAAALLAPLLLGAPSLRTWTTEGKRAIDRGFARITRDQFARDIGRADTPARARRLVGIVGYLGDPDLAIAALEKLIQLAPDDELARSTLAELELKLQEAAAAAVRSETAAADSRSR